jgi:hypothetical protein
VLRDPEAAGDVARNAARLVASRYSPAAFAQKAIGFATSIEALLKGAA